MLCEVEGGSEYELTLLGEASTIGFRLDRALIDFGKVLHAKREDKGFGHRSRSRSARGSTA